MADIAVLFARTDSIYRSISGCDVWDIERDARRWPGGQRVIAHPPCRAWGRLKHFAKPRHDEKALGLWAVEQVRNFGGVLEHPAHSGLWAAADLPLPGHIDAFGGWTLWIKQLWFGHRAEKATWLYFCGISPVQLAPIPFTLAYPTHVVAWSRKKTRRLPHIGKAERERTPKLLAHWLCDSIRGDR